MTPEQKIPAGTSPESFDIVAGLKGFVLWIGGSLAGITAVIYSVGFLVTRAHLSLLGLYGFVDFGSDYLLQEGSKFLIVVAYSFARTIALPLLAVFGIGMIGFVVIKHLIAHTRVMQWWGNASRHLPGLDAASTLRRIVFAVLFLAFLKHSDAYLDKFQRPLCIRNLLYENSGGATCAAAASREVEALKMALLHNNVSLLSSEFDNLLIGISLAVTLAYFAWRVAFGWRLRPWLVAPFFLAAAMYLVSLPLDYGVLQRPINYPRVVLVMAEGATLPGVGRLFLLSKAGADFVIWDKSMRKLFWLPTSSVKRAEIGAMQDLFDPALDDENAQGVGK